MNINRRKFIKASGVISAVAIHGTFYTFAATDLESMTKAAPATQASIEESIKANFGSGFQVLEHYKDGGITRAKIEHLENLYLVQSSDLLTWEINSSSVS